MSESHAVSASLLQNLLTVYRSQTLGTRNMANGTVILDEDNEVQPDACLWIDTRAFGNNDAQRVLATLQLGLDSKEHTAFVAQLAKTQKRRKGR